LGVCFGPSLASKTEPSPLAVWHSTPSDRTQREMLRAAVKAAFSPSILKPPRLEGRKASKRALDDVLWALDKAEALAPRRNNAIHSPFVLALEAEGVRLKPHGQFGNPSAVKLKGKDLLAEFIWYREQAVALTPFVV
jgi:hypothetical protein